MLYSASRRKWEWELAATARPVITRAHPTPAILCEPVSCQLEDAAATHAGARWRAALNPGLRWADKARLRLLLCNDGDTEHVDMCTAQFNLPGFLCLSSLLLQCRTATVSNSFPSSSLWYPPPVRTALLAIIGFMPSKGEGAIGSLDYTPEERKALAKK